MSASHHPSQKIKVFRSAKNPRVDELRYVPIFDEKNVVDRVLNELYRVDLPVIEG